MVINFLISSLFKFLDSILQFMDFLFRLELSVPCAVVWAQCLQWLTSASSLKTSFDNLFISCCDQIRSASISSFWKLKHADRHHNPAERVQELRAESYPEDLLSGWLTAVLLILHCYLSCCQKSWFLRSSVTDVPVSSLLLQLKLWGFILLF